MVNILVLYILCLRGLLDLQLEMFECRIGYMSLKFKTEIDQSWQFKIENHQHWLNDLKAGN